MEKLAILLITVVIVSVTLLLLFFRSKITWQRIVLVIGPTILLIVGMHFCFISARTTDVEYWGKYYVQVRYYEYWDEEVSCRHPVYCTRTYDCGTADRPQTCTDQYICGYEHSYDVDEHPEHWTKVDNYGNEVELTKVEFIRLQKQFSTVPYFVELHRDYHEHDGDAFYTDWNKSMSTAEVGVTEHNYENRIRVSHSIFKFDDIDNKTKLLWKLYDYPKVVNEKQAVVLGYPVTSLVERKLQYLNGFYGVNKQFKLFILFFKNQSIEAAYKQRSYWEGGNKNELIVCIGINNKGEFEWCKAFSWMDQPELEVPVQDYFVKGEKVDLNTFADWLPKQIEQHWQRKQFKDFDYLQIEITSTQLVWILVIVALYNAGVTFLIIKNS